MQALRRGAQVRFKAKPVHASVKQQRFAALQAEMRAKKEQARIEAEDKLRQVNAEFGCIQKRVADAMAAALQPFPGTVEDNIAGTSPTEKLHSILKECNVQSDVALGQGA